MQIPKYDVIVVGSGMGGLTTAAYTSRAKRTTLLLEKSKNPGGLFGTFTTGGYVFDHGARAIENSGIMFPMFKQLGIDLPFVKSPVHIRTKDHVVEVKSDVELDEYQAFLTNLFPHEAEAIENIVKDIIKISNQMHVLYGIENPLFIDDAFTNMKYITQTILPWAWKFITTIPKTQKFFKPVKEHLRKFTHNEQLIDFISQHFFEETPAIFAMSYFTLYMDYNYPKGGTGVVVKAFVDLIQQQGGTIQFESEVISIDLDQKTVQDQQGRVYGYKTLVWAGSPTHLHPRIKTTNKRIIKHQQTAMNKTKQGKGADSVMTVFMKVKDPHHTLAKQAGMHTFFTPYLDGLSTHPLSLIQSSDGKFIQDQDKVFTWLKEYYRRNTYEISVPVLRDASLAPPQESGFIVSVLLDYKLTDFIYQQGWYDAFKTLSNQYFVDILDDTWLKGLKENTYETMHASPLTMVKFASVHEGSLSGWSFANQPMLSEYLFTRVNKSILTPYPAIYQAGQWAFAPAGLPTCALTGKLAADRVIRETKMKH
jgi:phytoene dehydrogenase-like protein